MNLLITAFAGKTNSSRLLIDDVNSSSRLILTNSFVSCSEQIVSALKKLAYDRVILFGQKPKSSRLLIETKARGDVALDTNYNIDCLCNSLSRKGIEYEVSGNAGHYLCNHVYYKGLEFIKKHGLNTKMVFIHVPGMKCFIDFEKTKDWLIEYAQGGK